MQKGHQLHIYTDGSSRGNPGPGGYGAVLIWGDIKKELAGGYRLTTNNRMEMMGAIKALQHLKEPCKVKLYTDSKYLQQGATSWMKKWQLNNWRRGNTIVKNDDLWKSLAIEIDKHQVEFLWIKGHSNHPENELVDELARQACKKFL